MLLAIPAGEKLASKGPLHQYKLTAILCKQLPCIQMPHVPEQILTGQIPGSCSGAWTAKL